MPTSRVRGRAVSAATAAVAVVLAFPGAAGSRTPGSAAGPVAELVDGGAPCRRIRLRAVELARAVDAGLDVIVEADPATGELAARYAEPRRRRVGSGAGSG